MAQQDSLQRLLFATPEDSLQRRAFLLHELGKVATGQSEYTKAAEFTSAALELRLRQEASYPEPVLLSAFNLGAIHNFLEEYRSAIGYFQLVVDRAPNRKVGAALYQLGRCYGRLGDYQSADRAIREARELAPFAGNDYLQALASRSLTSIWLDEGSLAGGRRALQHALAARTYFGRGEDSDVNTLENENDIGIALINAGRPAEAIPTLREALGRVADSDEPEYLAALLNANLGLAYLKTEDYESARAAYQRTLDANHALSEGERPDIYLAEDYSNLAALFRAEGRADSALHYAQRAIRLGTISFDETSLAALPALEELEAFPQEQLSFLLEKARSWSLAGNFSAAVETYRHADALVDRMRENQLLRESRQAWRATAKAVHEEAIVAANEADDPESVFYFLEKSRARLLLDELTADRARGELPPAAAARLARATLAARRSGEGTQALFRFRAVRDSVFAAHPDFRRAQLGASPPETTELDGVLGENTLVEYFQSDSLTLALVRHPNGRLSTHELAPLSRWKPYLQRLRETVADPAATYDTEAALRLHRELIEPLALDAGSPLIIVPDGVLYLLPFAALVTDEAGGWLADRHRIGYAFSAQLLQTAGELRGRGNGKVLALAPVARLAAGGTLDPTLELPATLRTLEFISAHLPADTLVNTAANRDNFRDRADNYSLLHLGTHAYLGNEDKYASSFLLHDGAESRYTVEDLDNHRFRADLVVMGACETGLGRELPGEGIASLGRAFARRGAPALVMSLWSINDETTDDLLRRTYADLAAGAGPGSALQHAANTYRRDALSPKLLHPYYWAGLVYYGPDEALELSTTSNNSRWYLVGAIGVLLAVTLVLRTRF